MITPGRQLAWLALMEPYDVGAEATVLKRYATSTLTAFTAGAWGARGTIDGVIEDPFSIRATLLSSNRIAAHALPSVGNIVLKNPTGKLDDLLDYSWPGRRIELRLGYADDTSMASFDAAAPLGVKWIGTAKQPRATRDQIVIPLRGIEDLFDIPLQQNTFNPGFEPYFICDGVNDYIGFGNVLDFGSSGFAVGVSFLTTAPLHNGVLYGKRNLASTGWALDVTSGGLVRFALEGPGGGTFIASFTPTGGYNDGRLHSVVGDRNNTSDTVDLYHSVDGGTFQLVASVSQGPLTSVTNAEEMRIGASADDFWFFDGQIERAGADFGAPGVLLGAMLERYAEDVDASALSHYVPLTENFGTTAGDLSTNGFDGTLNGEFDSDRYWSGLREGTVDLGGKPKPILYGWVNHARPVLVDPVKQIYQVHDGDMEDGIAEPVGLWEGGVLITRDTTTSGDIWTNPPNAGSWRFQADSDGAFVRIVSAGGPENLQSELTFSRIDAGIDNTMAGIFAQLIAEHAEGRPEIVAAIDINGLTSAPDYVTGFYWREEIQLARAMDEVLVTADYHWTVNGREPFEPITGNMVLEAFQIRDVGSETPDVILTLDSDTAVSDVARDGFEIGAHVPHWKELIVEYDKADGWMPLSQSLPGNQPQDAKVRNRLASEWLSLGPPILVQPQDILDAYLDGKSPTVQTGIRFASDAETEGLRRLAVYDLPRPIAQLQRTADEWGLWIGAVVQVNGTRFGTGAGPKYLLLGIEDRTTRGNAGTRMYLYGGFTS